MLAAMGFYTQADSVQIIHGYPDADPGDSQSCSRKICGDGR